MLDGLATVPFDVLGRRIRAKERMFDVWREVHDGILAEIMGFDGQVALAFVRGSTYPPPGSSIRAPA
jgi:hypothetical protein